MAEVGVGSVLRGPVRAAGGCSASSSSVAERSELPPERLAEPIEALEAGAPPELVRLGLWVAERVLLDAARGAWRWCCRPASGPARGRGSGRRRELRAERDRRRAGPRSRDGDRGSGSRQRAALAARSPAPASSPAAELAASGRRRPARLCGGSRRAAWSSAATSRACAARPRIEPVGAGADGAVELSARPAARCVEAIVAALDGDGPPRAAPAPRRHRLGQDRGLPAAAEAALDARPRRRSCSSPRSP